MRPAHASTLERRLTVVKVAKPNQDMRFDVPVIGMRTIETMIGPAPVASPSRPDAPCSSIATALLAARQQAGIAIVAVAALILIAARYWPVSRQIALSSTRAPSPS